MSESHERRSGRDVLFGAPVIEEDRPKSNGRSPLFSAPPRRRGTVVVECEDCQGRTPVPAPELVVRLMFSFWLPLRSFSRLMRCPSCGSLTWCRVHWRTLF